MEEKTYLGIERIDKITQQKPDCEGKEFTMGRTYGKNGRGEHAKKGPFGKCTWI